MNSFKIKNVLKNILKRIFSFNIISAFIFLFIFSILGVIIFNVLISEKIIKDWENIYYISQTINVLITLMIPLLIFNMQKNMDKKESKENISKIDLEDRIEKLEKELNSATFLVTEQSKKIVSKNDIYKYICINEGSSLSEISSGLGIDIDYIKPFITELCLFDRLITTTLNVNPKDPSLDSKWFRRNL